ncbi:MAG TPA: DUF4186 family protein [Solirubrobacterales bacterium]
MAPSPPLLKITCKSTKCDSRVSLAERRHAFSSPLAEGVLPGIGGPCIACGTDTVEWGRCHARDPEDHEGLFGNMRQELLRDHYWGLELPEHVLRKARKRSSEQLQTTIGLDLRRALVPDHFVEGRQTPFAENEEKATISTCSQHAIGTCCRACLEKWHGIPHGVVLGGSEYDYLGGLAWIYVERRLELSDSNGSRR